MTMAGAHSPVTLNLSQGPSLIARRTVATRHNGTVAPVTRASLREVRWMLKLVRHDDVVREAGT
jgi:hypothetical protein